MRDGCGADEPGAHDVVEGAGRDLGASVGDCGGDGGRVGDGDGGEDAGWVRGGHFELVRKDWNGMEWLMDVVMLI